MTRRYKVLAHHLEGEQVSWAGHNAWSDSKCFGTESGKLITVPKDTSKPALVSSTRVATDAVNGAAFLDKYAAFTSRDSIAIGERGDNYSILPVGNFIEGGAHGVVASSYNCFLASAGSKGDIRITPTGKGDVSARFIQLENSPFYAYRTISLNRDLLGETVVVAARNQGVVSFKHNNSDDEILIAYNRFSNLDIVSVCKLGDTRAPRGVAALTKDCKVVFIRDVFTPEKRMVLDFSAIAQTAYDIIVLNGNVILLTSDRVLGFGNVLEEVILGEVKGAHRYSFMQNNTIAIYPSGGEAFFFQIDDGIAKETALSEFIEGFVGGGQKSFAKGFSSRSQGRAKGYSKKLLRLISPPSPKSVKKIEAQFSKSYSEVEDSEVRQLTTYLDATETNYRHDTSSSQHQLQSLP